MLARIAASRAVHLFPASIADVAPPGVEVIPVEDLPPVRFSLVWRRNVALPEHVKALVADVLVPRVGPPPGRHRRWDAGSPREVERAYGGG